MLKGNAVIGQSGGPTSVINSSLAGVMEEAGKAGIIEKLFGMKYGIEGFMDEILLDLPVHDKSIINGLRQTPSSALGSSRHKLTEMDFARILEVLKKYNIRYFFLIGGNDSMDTVHRVEVYCREQDYELIGIGIPKTVDNDLFGTDHTPGFASAARCNILNVKEAGRLAEDMKMVDKFVVYQTIGREAGWLSAATALASQKSSDAPHLIYCPEKAFRPDEFIEDAKSCIDRYGWVSIVVSEGLLYEDGTAVSAAGGKDKFNNTEFGAMGGASVAMNVHKILSQALGGARGEFQIPESLIMSAIDRAETSDLKEAYLCGVEAVRIALKGESGFMITLERQQTDPVSFSFGRAPLESVAVKARAMPDDFINERGNYVSEKFLDYMKPLISELPGFTSLEEFYYRIEE